MPRFEQIRDPSDNPRLKALYKQIVDAGFGKEFPLHWFTAQAGRPDILEVTWALVRGLLLEGELAPTIKQMIIVRVSTTNNCRYCRVIHTDALEALGVPAEVIDTLTTDVNPAKLPPVQRAVVEFAAKTGANPKSITDEDFKSLRGYGLSNGEIIEVAMIAAFANFLNAWAEVSGILTDREEASA